MSTPRTGSAAANPPRSTGPRMPTDRNLPMLPSNFALSRSGSSSSGLGLGIGMGTGIGIGLGIVSDENQNATVPLSTRGLAARGAGEAGSSLDLALPPATSSSSSSASAILHDSRTTQELERKLRDSRRESLELKARYASEVGALQREGARWKGELEKAEGKTLQLKEDRDFLHTSHTTLSSQLTELQKQHTELRATSDATISKLRRESIAMKDQIGELQAQLSAYASQTPRKEAEFSATRAALEARVAAAEEQSRRAKEMAQSGIRERGELQARMEQLERELREERARGARSEDAEVIARQLREQQPYIAQLKQKANDLAAENNALRSRLDNSEILKSERESLQKELDRTLDLRKRNQELERELALAQAEKAQWAAYLPKDEPGTPAGARTPAGLAKKAYRATLELALQKEKAGEAVASRAALESELADAEARLNSANARITELESSLAKSEAKATRADKSKQLLNREIELLRARCASYELELGEAGASPAMDAQAQSKGWEANLEAYKTRVAELEREVNEHDAAPGGSVEAFTSDKIRAYQAKIHELEGLVAESKTEREMLEKQCAVLDEQVGVLERALGRGEYDPETTRVLEIRDNPYSQSQAIRQERLDRLLAENAALLSGSKDPMVPSASLKRAEFDLQQARKEVEEGAKRLDRLKKVFGEQAGVVREAVLKVLGWKLDADPLNSRITLRSTFSAHDSHCFYFNSAPNNPSENLKFLGAGNQDFLAGLDPGVAHYVTKYGSIPALLAWVTLDGFKRVAGTGSMLPTSGEAEEDEQRKRRRM